MLPIALDMTAVPVVLAGGGPFLLRRLDLVLATGHAPRAVFAPDPDDAMRARAGALLQARLPDAADLPAGGILFAAGLPEAEAEALYRTARGAGLLVNVEDVARFCDFHVPAMVRRGDLLVTVSTGGRSPGLARRLRRYLEALIGPEWAARLDEIADARLAWRREGLDAGAVSAKTEDLISSKGWLP